MRNVLFYAPFLLVPFTIQLAVLFATRRRFRPLRFALPILVGAVSVAVIPLYCFFTLKDGWNFFLLDIFFILAFINLCMILASLALMGWGSAWVLYYLIKHKAGNTP